MNSGIKTKVESRVEKDTRTIGKNARTLLESSFSLGKRFFVS